MDKLLFVLFLLPIWAKDEPHIPASCECDDPIVYEGCKDFIDFMNQLDIATAMSEANYYVRDITNCTTGIKETITITWKDDIVWEQREILYGNAFEAMKKCYDIPIEPIPEEEEVSCTDISDKTITDFQNCMKEVRKLMIPKINDMKTEINNFLNKIEDCTSKTL